MKQEWRACAGNLNWTSPIPVLGHCGPFTGRAETLHPPPVQGQQTRTHRALRIECERRGSPHSRPGQGWSPSAPRGGPQSKAGDRAVLAQKRGVNQIQTPHALQSRTQGPALERGGDTAVAPVAGVAATPEGGWP